MKGSEYLAKYRKALFYNTTTEEICTAEKNIFQEMFIEACNLIRQRHAYSKSATFAVFKEINNKLQTIHRLASQHPSISEDELARVSIFEKNTFIKYVELALTDITVKDKYTGYVFAVGELINEFG